MIKKLILILLFQGAVVSCNIVFGQEDKGFFQKLLNGNNRFSIQTGMFHQFFDGTAIVNPERTDENKTFVKQPLHAWGSRLNDSWGWTYRRKINDKSALMLEWMTYQARYRGLFTEWEGSPVMSGRGRKKYSLTYFRLIPVIKNVDLNFGLGVNYQWGREGYKLKHSPFLCYTDDNLLNERKDLGLNLKSGFDYTPIKQLTLSVGVDWTRSIFVETKNEQGIDTREFFESKYGITQFPSKSNLSFNLAVGFNF